MHIVGMILGSIVGILLLLVFAVLFVPFRYRLSIMIDENKDVFGRCTWLYPLLIAKVGFETEVFYQVKLLGIPIYHSGKSRGIINDEGLDEELKETSERTEVEDSQEKKKFSLWNVKDEIVYYYDIWKKPVTKEAVKQCIAQLGYLYGKIKPKRLQAIVEYGAKDPDATGMVMAYVGMFYPLIGPYVQVIPHFNEEILLVNGTAKGQIRLIHFVQIAFALYKSRELKYVMKLLKKREVTNGGKS